MTKKRFKLNSEIGFIDTQKCGEDTMTLFEVVVELNKLNEENEQLKQLINDKEVEWLRNNTVWEQMPTNKRTVTKTTFGDKND